ncbi:MAG: flagellar motor protein MotB [Gammaproteobacteria bacterium]|nr:flagellar motor protein MotB [Gammaproteobacteria bacterium]
MASGASDPAAEAAEDQAKTSGAPAAAAAEAPAPAEPSAPLQPIIIKKIIDEGHAGGHGGAWKIALADMMTAMMAFFLLMWLLGATNADQRKSIAEYFQPTNAPRVDQSGGSNGFFGGMSLIDPKSLPLTLTQTGIMQLSAPGTEEQQTTAEDQALPQGLSEEERRKIAAEQDEKRFEKLQDTLEKQIGADAKTSDLLSMVKFVREKEGLRIEILDSAGFSMFSSGTNKLSSEATSLIEKVGESLKNIPNEIAVRGHTDNLQFKNGGGNNNWSLSANRADATRQFLNSIGVDDSRFSRIEGVADSQPVNPENPADPRNRRISITVLYRDGARPDR